MWCVSECTFAPIVCKKSPGHRFFIGVLGLVCAVWGACDANPSAGSNEKPSDEAVLTSTASLLPPPPPVLSTILLEPLPTPPEVTVPGETLDARSGGGLAIVASRPQGLVHGDVKLAVTFNKPVVSLESADTRSPPTIDLQPAISGKWNWVGTTSAEFVPDQPFPWATAFRVTVPAGQRALDGSTLLTAHTFTFETQSPKLQSSKPEPNWRWLPSQAQIQLQFNIPVRDLASHLVVRVQDQPVKFAVVPGRRSERSAWDEVAQYEVRLSEEIPPATRIRLSIDGGLQAEDGPLTAPAHAIEYATAGPMEILEVRPCEKWNDYCPFGPIEILTSNEVDVTSLRTRLRLIPSIELAEDAFQTQVSVSSGASVQISGKFQPGITYQVFVSEGLKDATGQTASAFRGEVSLPHLEPSLSLPDDVVLIESSGDASLPIETVNIAAVQVEAHSLSPPQMAKMLLGRGDRSYVPVSTLKSQLSVGDRRNVGVRTPYPLMGLFEAGQPKFFRIGVTARELPEEEHFVIGQITDLAPHAKLGATSSLVWVTSVSQGKPIADAKVRLLDEEGAELAEAVTNADGIAGLPGLNEIVKRGTEHTWRVPGVVIVAEKDGDAGISASGWDYEIGPASSEVEFAWTSGIEEAGQLVAERGIYRPGDKVHLKGFVRLLEDGKIKLPKTGSRIQVELTTDEEVVAEQQLVLSAFGTLTASLTIPPDASLGWYQARAHAVIGKKTISFETNLRVEEYRAPPFKVDVGALRSELVSGDTLRVQSEGRYLFGAPMAVAAVQTTVLRSTQEFSPPGLNSYQFGIHVWGYDDGKTGVYKDIFARKSDVLNKMGVIELDLGQVDAPAGRTAEYEIESEVTDVNRQRVANRTRVLVHPASIYVGVRSDDGFGDVGKTMSVDLVTAETNGARTGGVTVDVKIRRRQWRSIRKKNSYTGRYETYSEPETVDVGTCAQTTDANGAAACLVKADHSGIYVIDATATDPEGRTQTTRVSRYVVGSDWVPWQRNDGKLIDLVADRKIYAQGEIAKVLVKNPWPEAEALITVEREGVLHHRQQRLVGTEAIEIPIGEDAFPNVFVSVLLVRGRISDEGVEGVPVQENEEPSPEVLANEGDSEEVEDDAVADEDPGRPQVLAGYIRLPVDTKAKRLQVAIDTGQSTYRPGTKVKLKLRVQDAEGRGQNTEVALWAVDEAILRLTGYELRDPVEAIHRPRSLSVALAEPILHLLRRQSYGEKGRPPGGDGESSGGRGFRANFKNTAFFIPSIETNARGEGEVEVVLPDDLTTYRVLALAVNKGDLAGFGRAELVVQKPLLAIPTTPRFARVGDQFEAGVVIHSKQDGLVSVEAEADGLSMSRTKSQQVQVLAGRAVEVRFPFSAEKAGRARLRFRVQQNGESDAIEQSFPVSLPIVLETFAAYGSTDAKAEEALVPPKGAHPNLGGLTLHLASSELAGFQGALEQLVDYPYGCAEQTASRLVPFLAIRELQGAYAVPVQSTRSQKPKLQSTRKSKSAKKTKIRLPKYATAGIPSEPIAGDILANWLGLPSDSSEHPDEIAESAIRSLEKLQTPTGGFGYWSSSRCDMPTASAYVTLALAHAHKLGYPVRAEVLKNAKQHLKKNIASNSLSSCGFGTRDATPAERAFAVWVLSRSGVQITAFLEELFQKREQLPMYAKAMLLDAHILAGLRPTKNMRAQSLLREILNGARESAREVHFVETERLRWGQFWSSDVRTTAIVMMSLVALDPGHPFVDKAARWLKNARVQGRYATTQDAAFSLMAISEMLRAREREPADFEARLWLGNEKIVQQKFVGRSLDVVSHFIPLINLGTDAKSLVLQKDGVGRLTYGVSLQYAKESMPTTPKDSGIAVQRWFEPHDPSIGVGQVRGIRAGELVRLQVRVATSTERRFVVVDVPLPAGLEIVDATLQSTGIAALIADGHRAENKGASEFDQESSDDDGAYDELGEEWEGDEESHDWIVPDDQGLVFQHVEARDDRAMFFADILPPGVHTATMIARATSIGTFVWKPAVAEQMYAPETFGRSDGGWFQVFAP